jgi:hypothetical protein
MAQLFWLQSSSPGLVSVGEIEIADIYHYHELKLALKPVWSLGSYQSTTMQHSLPVVSKSPK